MSAQNHILTFGCRLNAFESEVMRRHADDAGLHDAIIINSCAVTGEAVRQTRQAIRKARRENPDARIIVTGCAAQLDGEDFAAMSEVDHVLGNSEKLSRDSFAAIAAGDAAHLRVNDIMAVRSTANHLIDGFGERSRAFVEVQNGCDHRCTFCIIPFARGKSRSVPVVQVVRQIQNLVQQGFQEVVLTGVDLTSYGPDLPGAPRLGTLVEAILTQVSNLPRLRLSSVDCIELDDQLISLFGEHARLMPHLHLSLQSGNDMILKRMKRRHSRADSLRLMDRIRRVRPDMVFGADFIAGFPTEDDAMFQGTLDLVTEADLTFLHVFPYSPRPGTPAANMPQVAAEVRKQRAADLRALGDTQLHKHLQQKQGQRISVLVERDSDGVCLGHDQQFAPVQLAGHHSGIVQARVTGMSDSILQAVAA